MRTCKERKSEVLELPAHTLLPRQSRLGSVIAAMKACSIFLLMLLQLSPDTLPSDAALHNISLRMYVKWRCQLFHTEVHVHVQAGRTHGVIRLPCTGRMLGSVEQPSNSPAANCRLMQKLWDQLVSSERDAMLTLLTPKMDAVLVHLL